MKSKKLVGALVAVVMSASLAAGLSACKGGGHTHSWQWKDVGGGYHRQECTSCDETTSPVPHRNENGDNLCDDCNVDLSTVVEVTSVTLDRQSAEMTVGGETLTLHATVNPEGAATVVWESSDKSVATVSASGVVTAVKAGNAVITAKAGAKSAQCAIKVNAAAPSTPVNMTAEKWEQAFTFSGKVGFEQTYKYGDRDAVSAAKFDGNVTYMNYREGEYGEEAYIVTGTKNYFYSKSYEYWTKVEMPSADLGQGDAREVLDTLIDMFPFNKFEKGTINGEYVTKEAYTVTFTSSSGEPQTMSIKQAKINFSADGKIVSMEHVAVEEGGDESYTTTFSYGETLTLPEVLEGEQVTKEEWNAALKMSDSNYRMGLGSYGALSFEYHQNGADKKFVIGEYFIDNTEKEEMYFTKDDGKFYRYNGTHGHWSRKELNEMTDEIYGSEITAFGFIDVDLSQYAFEAFTYNAEAKAYVMASGDVTVVAMFKNKKLVWATLTEQYSSFTVEIVYGDAEVTLPTVAAGEQVSDTEWNDAFAMNFDNIDAYVEVNSSLMNGELVFKKVGNTMYQHQTAGMSVETYVDKQGDKYYQYEVENGVWKKTEIEKNVYDQFGPAALFASLSKSDFTYDEASGTYKTSDGSMVIKFVDKKVDILNVTGAMSQNMYFSYGTAELTLPKEGSSVSGGNQGGNTNPGGDISVKPSTKKDITVDDWQNLFNETQNSKMLTVYKNFRGGNETYTFNSEEGYIYVSTFDEQTEQLSEYVLAIENGVVCKFELVDGRIVKTPTELPYLSDIKLELFNEFYVNEKVGNVKELYDNFAGSEGYYRYEISNGTDWCVQVMDGVLSDLYYNNLDEYTSYHFEYMVMQAPNWYLDNYGTKKDISADEWQTVFETTKNDALYLVKGWPGYASERYVFNEAEGYISIVYDPNTGEPENRSAYFVRDGEIKRITYDAEKQVFNDEESTSYNSLSEIRNEVFEDVFNDKYFGNIKEMYENFSGENGNYTYRESDTCFAMANVENGRLSGLSFNYNMEEDFETFWFEYGIGETPEWLTDYLENYSETRWREMVQATLNATNFVVTESHSVDGIIQRNSLTNYVDMDKGIIYRKDVAYINTYDELYLNDGGNVWCYKPNVDKTQFTKSAYSGTLQNVYDSIMQQIFSPSILGGNLLESFSSIAYEGQNGYAFIVDENTYIRLYFNEGKIERMYVFYKDGETNVHDMYEFSSFGEVDLNDSTLPDWYVNGTEKTEP